MRSIAGTIITLAGTILLPTPIGVLLCLFGIMVVSANWLDDPVDTTRDRNWN
jgi:hypothetical protein